ncbi:DotI/IcmL/TraM family protein [Halomonas elongata]|uniref:DotI/IcmL/TraM family protein n=1 Tax=Halomonas elongata TaxID=2746 RepID=UPI00255AACF4|nr:DotI/IcmL/TraM family protein [Halomonas elongata]MDL4860780.1 DotI/IcmL/TraM family protein [Halomonas elongata]
MIDDDRGHQDSNLEEQGAADAADAQDQAEDTGLGGASQHGKDETLRVFGGVLLNEQSRKFVSKVASGVTKVSFIMGACLAGSIALNGYLGYKIANVQPEYFASTGNGRIIPLVPLSQPVMSVADVIDFAQKATRRSMTMDFLNYREQLENSRKYFTDAGFQSFLNSLSSSGILDTIRNSRYNMNATTETGVLAQQGVVDGRRVYIVNFPLTVKLAGQTSERPDQEFLATVRVERISTAIDAQGIAITQVVTEPR